MSLDSTALSSSSSLQILQFLYELGVDEAINDDAGDFLKPPALSLCDIQPASAGTAPAPHIQSLSPINRALASPTHPAQVNIQTAAAPAQPSSLQHAIEEARHLADNAQNLQELEQAVRSFNGCALKATAKQTVFARGNANSRLLLIGEAPGADEDKQGIPFCGPSGRLLDQMLHFLGLKANEDYYITNSVFWRPPGNRPPTAEEISICRPFVEKHISLISPQLIVLVGGTAIKSLLERNESITRLRGKQIEYKNVYIKTHVPTYAIFHPAYLLRQPTAKKTTWMDLLCIKDALVKTDQPTEM